ncbi:hypothetical protein FRC06_004282 [Ceratobasidium sp. 370]|nr:hypothetical protein FRC06_004282 [Ceratobasidium sp. 370]
MPALLSISSNEHTAYSTHPHDLIPNDPPEHVSVTVTSPTSTEPCALSHQGWFLRITLACKWFTARIVASLGVFAALIWRKKTPEHDLESGVAVDTYNQGNVCEAIGRTRIASDAPHAPSSPIVPARCSGTASDSDVTLAAPSTPVGASRPSRFIDHLPDHQLFADTPASVTSNQPSTVDNEPNGCELFAPLGEQDRLRMHEEAAARIKMPALRPFRARSTVSVATVAPYPHFEPQQAILANPINRSGLYTCPKRSSVYYESYKQGTGPGLKEWVEDVRSGRNEFTTMGPSTLSGRRLEVMIPQSPPSSPESSGPVTPISEFTGALRTLVDGGKEDNLADLAPAYRGWYNVGGDGATAL